MMIKKAADGLTEKTTKTKLQIDDPFPIVGIGASAGGLKALEAFFSGVPADTNSHMAFVIVQHLAPDHKSILTELIQRFTKMQVFEVTDGMLVQPNCAYIIPPGRDMAFINGSLQLLEPALPHGKRLPIDFFFRSLAEDQHERAIGIILSGTGSDGTLGIRAIKGEGGMVMAQTPESAEYDGMPSNAIATGLVDYIIEPDKMASRLISYVQHAFGRLPKGSASLKPKSENALKKIFVLLRAHSGNDFSHYKSSTIMRRIERRMAVHQIETIDDYARFMQQTPVEVESLFRDLLIGVTNFFRDPEAFKVLEEQVIPNLLEGKPMGSQIRVWVVGCSTGEEAYSIAILIQEMMDLKRTSLQVQVFATDIDENAIAKARMGIYPASIAEDVSAERLARFFTCESGGTVYRIRKSIRDMLIFSEQNVIKDPPFSKVDLITCRNMMIYMDVNLQKKIIPLFHYALNANGILFLGTSETVGEFHHLFEVLDRKAKLFKRKSDTKHHHPVAISEIVPPFTIVKNNIQRGPITIEEPSNHVFKRMTEQAMLDYKSMVAILVNDHGQMLYIHGQTGKYFELTTGTVENFSILNMAREGLRQKLTIALHKASRQKVAVSVSNILVKMQDGDISVNLTITPVAMNQFIKQEATLFVVILDEATNSLPGVTEKEDAGGIGKAVASSQSDLLEIEALKQELRTKEEYLQSTNEELESSNEELKSSNEEMQSVNEELQSTNEELETSKEELQSVNEELATVNSELQTKIVDLSRANNDMNNLLAGTGIATIYIDYGLRILRFTPAATQLINLIQADIGRPVGHVVTNLVNYNNLVNDLRSVLDTLIPFEVEVRTLEGKWYTLRISPYRTLDNVIEGVVITFVDITAIVNVRESLEKAIFESRMAFVIRDSKDAIISQSLKGEILAWNHGAENLYGWTEQEAQKLPLAQMMPTDRYDLEIEAMYKRALVKSFEPYRTQRVAKDGSLIEVCMIINALVDETGTVYGLTTTERPA